MSKEITLPSGNTVKLRDPESLLKKDRDKAVEISSRGENELLQSTLLQDGLISVCVLEWSFDLIPPSVRIASLGELSPKDFDALRDACLPALDVLFPGMNPTDENQADPKVITANSSD